MDFPPTQHNKIEKMSNSSYLWCYFLFQYPLNIWQHSLHYPPEIECNFCVTECLRAIFRIQFPAEQVKGMWKKSEFCHSVQSRKNTRTITTTFQFHNSNNFASILLCHWTFSFSPIRYNRISNRARQMEEMNSVNLHNLQYYILESSAIRRFDEAKFEFTSSAGGGIRIQTEFGIDKYSVMQIPFSYIELESSAAVV